MASEAVRRPLWPLRPPKVWCLEVLTTKEKSEVFITNKLCCLQGTLDFENSDQGCQKGPYQKSAPPIAAAGPYLVTFIPLVRLICFEKTI